MEVPGNFWRKKKANGQSKSLGMRGALDCRSSNSQKTMKREVRILKQSISKSKGFCPMMGVELTLKWGVAFETNLFRLARTQGITFQSSFLGKLLEDVLQQNEVEN